MSNKKHYDEVDAFNQYYAEISKNLLLDAATYGVTTEAIRKKEHKALTKMRSVDNCLSLSSYLDN